MSEKLSYESNSPQPTADYVDFENAATVHGSLARAVRNCLVDELAVNATTNDSK